MSKRLIIMGAPGAGKGTMGAIIIKMLNIPQVSTGNILREAIHNGTEMGLKAKDAIDSGKFVSDDIVIGIVKYKLASDECKNGFLLDGFPRTTAQAEALDTMTEIDAVIDLQTPEELIKARLSGRRVCPKCGATYHIVNIPPKKEGVCDECSSELIIRKDDVPETIDERLRAYHESTEPLESFYENKGVLKKILCDNDIDATTERIKTALESCV